MKITDTNEISASLENFKPCSQGAFPTGRLIQGADSAMDPQEWAERGTVDGKEATVFYIFSEEEASPDDAENYPWDINHINHIEIEDEEIPSKK
jgi:hypothetical protein